MKKKLFAIIDIETTGSLPKQDRITEIAIALHDGHKVIETFETLINPERPIPRNITHITGISDQMVEAAPRFHEVARRIVEMTEGAVFVAHNVRFDYHFLQAQYASLGFTYKRSKLCTIRLAKKAFPGLRRYGLDALSKHFNIINNGRHRAMGDVMATVQIFEKSLSQVDPGILGTFLKEGTTESLLPVSITKAKLDELPGACGVYNFHDGNGEVLYVGKSINMRNRVVQHFNHQSEKARKLQHAVDSISYTITGSELISLLLETSQIKAIQPIYNVAVKSTTRRWCVYRYKNDAGYLCLHYAPQGKIPVGDVVQSFSSQKDAMAFIRNLGKKDGICSRYLNLDHHGTTCFNFHLNRCKGACKQLIPPDDYNMHIQQLLLLNENGFDGLHYIIDKGRIEDEKAIIQIEDGIYRGFGYAYEEDINPNPDYWPVLIKNEIHYPEHIRILRDYLVTHPKMKIIQVENGIPKKIRI